jgi:hypothetical protein
MESHGVILRIDHCLRTSRSEGRRRELLQICRENLHLTGDQLFNAFRGHLDVVTLQGLVSTWDTWRGILSIRRSRTPRRSSTSQTATRAVFRDSPELPDTDLCGRFSCVSSH